MLGGLKGSFTSFSHCSTMIGLRWQIDSIILVRLRGRNQVVLHARKVTPSNYITCRVTTVRRFFLTNSQWVGQSRFPPSFPTLPMNVRRKDCPEIPPQCTISFPPVRTYTA